MPSDMAKGSEVIGECVEGIRVEVRREVLRMVLVCPVFSVWRTVPHWVCCQSALSAMVPGIGGWFKGAGGVLKK